MKAIIKSAVFYEQSFNGKQSINFFHHASTNYYTLQQTETRPFTKES